MNIIMEIQDLTVSFLTNAGEVQAVRGVSFDVKSGKTLALVGESGCGKTVTAKALIGLNENAVNGEKRASIRYGNKELSVLNRQEWNAYRGKEIAMIFQDALVALNPTMKIGDQIMEGMQNHFSFSKQEQYEKAIDMLHLVSIPNPEDCMKMYPHELSGGMRQRVMIASALVMEPKVLIADEPTTALDVTIQAQIIELLKELQKKFNMSIILITHDLGLVADIADEIIVMYAGKIVEKGTCEDIFFHPQHPYTWGLLHAVPSLTMDKKMELTTIDGSVPDMINLPKGCAFCNRCRYAMRICREQLPLEYMISDIHKVSCWLQEDEAPKEDIPFLAGGNR